MTRKRLACFAILGDCFADAEVIMAFCTSCGAQVADTAQFWTTCGKPLPVPAETRTTAGATAAQAPAPAAGSGSAAKVILIVVAVVVGLGILSVAISALIGYRAIRHARVEHTRSGTRITSGTGTVETTTDPAKVAATIGIELYPGARLVEEGSNVNFGNMSAASGEFESDDPPQEGS